MLVGYLRSVLLRILQGKRRLFPPVRIGCVRVQNPVLLCGGLLLLFYWDSMGWMKISLLVSVLHELGHAILYRRLCGQWPEIEVGFTGFCICSADQFLSREKELLITLAGPAVNLFLAGVTYIMMQQRSTLRRMAFLWANLLIGGFNLLPVPPLDGWNILRLIFGL